MGTNALPIQNLIKHKLTIIYQFLCFDLNTSAQIALSLRKSILQGQNKAILKIRYCRICNRNNAFIPLNAKIGEGIIFPRGLCGIFISQGAVIGKNCTIFHQVTIGSNTLQDSKNFGAPIIGDNCYIGAGAKIIGGIRVGNNVRIGANTVVAQDVPSNSTVVAQVSRVIAWNSVRDNTFTSFSNHQ